MLIRVLIVLTLTAAIYSLPVFAQASRSSTSRSAGRYVCPMHPEVTSSKPGKCPKCKMALRYTRTKATTPSAPAPETKSADSNAISSIRIPDIKIQDQNGKSLNFYRDLVRGKVVAVNFVFTTCTAICPSLTATFRKLQQQLNEHKIEAQLISVSVDPTVDTPERLNAFAARFNAEPGWTFVTGNSSDIDLLLQQFGVAVSNKNDHTPMILIGNDAAGYWTRAYGLSSPTALVKLITEAADRK